MMAESGKYEQDIYGYGQLGHQSLNGQDYTRMHFRSLGYSVNTVKGIRL